MPIPTQKVATEKRSGFHQMFLLWRRYGFQCWYDNTHWEKSSDLMWKVWQGSKIRKGERTPFEIGPSRQEMINHLQSKLVTKRYPCKKCKFVFDTIEKFNVLLSGLQHNRIETVRMMTSTLITVDSVVLFWNHTKKQMTINPITFNVKNAMFVSITNSSGKIMSRATYFEFSILFSNIVNCELWDKCGPWPHEFRLL